MGFVVFSIINFAVAFISYLSFFFENVEEAVTIWVATWISLSAWWTGKSLESSAVSPVCTGLSVLALMKTTLAFSGLPSHPFHSPLIGMTNDIEHHVLICYSVSSLVKLSVQIFNPVLFSCLFLELCSRVKHLKNLGKV